MKMSAMKKGRGLETIESQRNHNHQRLLYYKRWVKWADFSLRNK